MSNKILTPLHKSWKRGSSGSDWKKAYQAVKHDRVNSLQKGNIKNLIRALAALYILNLYYKSEIFDLGKDHSGLNLSENMGSDIFSVKVHTLVEHEGSKKYRRAPDYNESLYYIKWNPKSETKIFEALSRMVTKQYSYLINHPKFDKWSEINGNDIRKYSGKNVAWDILGKNDYVTMINETHEELSNAHMSSEYEAKINKDDL